MRGAAGVAAVAALLAVPAPARAAGPTLVLQVYVNSSCSAVHCESELQKFVCTAMFTSPVLTDVGVNTSVSCWAETTGLHVPIGAIGFVGPIAVGGGVAGQISDGTICVSATGLYANPVGTHPVAAGPVCKSAHSWPPLQSLVTDAILPII